MPMRIMKSNKDNIPLYRAKKIDGDEYIEGFLTDCGFCADEGMYAIENRTSLEAIDPSTLSIHFPNMIDSEKNKIFASLSEDGRGGSRTHTYTFIFSLDRVKALYVLRSKKKKLLMLGVMTLKK